MTRLPNEALLENQITYLYTATAKGLYNLALYSVQDQQLAEQLAIDAFVFAYNCLSNKTDVTRFQIKGTRQLYRKTKKMLMNHSSNNSMELNKLENKEFANDESKKRIHSLLERLNFDDRFLLLLFLQQKLSQKQIAQILSVPKFAVKKRLYRAINKAMNIWS